MEVEVPQTLTLKSVNDYLKRGGIGVQRAYADFDSSNPGVAHFGEGSFSDMQNVQATVCSARPTSSAGWTAGKGKVAARALHYQNAP